MTFLNEQVLFWTFSTIAQALAALIALSAMAAFHVLERHKAVIRSTREQLIRWLQYGETHWQDEREKHQLERAVEGGLWSPYQVKTAVWTTLNNVHTGPLKAKYGVMMEDVSRAVSKIAAINRGLKVWVSCGAAAICFSMIALPFVSFMVRVNVPRWLPIGWLVVVLLAAMTTVVGVAGQFLAWLGYDRDSAKKRKPRKRTTPEKRTAGKDR